MMMQLGGHVTGGEGGEFGRAFIEVEKPCTLFDGLSGARAKSIRCG
jgi:GMP synthase (glutamine-hydrolysing)